MNQIWAGTWHAQPIKKGAYRIHTIRAWVYHHKTQLNYNTLSQAPGTTRKRSLSDKKRDSVKSYRPVEPNPLSPLGVSGNGPSSCSGSAYSTGVITSWAILSPRWTM